VICWSSVTAQVSPEPLRLELIQSALVRTHIGRGLKNSAHDARWKLRIGGVESWFISTLRGELVPSPDPAAIRFSKNDWGSASSYWSGVGFWSGLGLRRLF
jgi:hypothetical protein